MSLGVHFALAPADYDRILAIDDPDELVEFISEDPFPLAYAVLGGSTLDAGDDYTACLVDCELLSPSRRRGASGLLQDV